MKFLDNVKEKFKSICRKLGGVDVTRQPAFANLKIYINNDLKVETNSTDGDLPTKFCNLIEYFATYNDYNIIFDYVNKNISIYFNVKKDKIK